MNCRQEFLWTHLFIFSFSAIYIFLYIHESDVQDTGSSEALLVNIESNPNPVQL